MSFLRFCKGKMDFERFAKSKENIAHHVGELAEVWYNSCKAAIINFQGRDDVQAAPAPALLANDTISLLLNGIVFSACMSFFSGEFIFPGKRVFQNKRRNNAK